MVFSLHRSCLLQLVMDSFEDTKNEVLYYLDSTSAFQFYVILFGHVTQFLSAKFNNIGELGDQNAM